MHERFLILSYQPKAKCIFLAVFPEVAKTNKLVER